MKGGGFHELETTMCRRLLLLVGSLALLTLPLFNLSATAKPQKQAAPGYEFSPKMLNFGHVPWGTNDVQLLTLTLDKSRFNANRLPPLSSDVGATITQYSRREDARQVALIYAVTMPGDPGSWVGRITFVGPAYGPDPADPRDVPLEGKGVDLAGEVVPGVSVSPPQIDFGTVRQGMGGKRFITLAVPNGDIYVGGKFVGDMIQGGKLVQRWSVQVRNATVVEDTPYLSARYVLGMGSMVSFGATYEVTLDPKTPPMTLLAHLTFRTKGGQIITVPVFAEVKATQP